MRSSPHSPKVAANIHVTVCNSITRTQGGPSGPWREQAEAIERESFFNQTHAEWQTILVKPILGPKENSPVCQCWWGVALPCLRSHARQIAIVSSPRPECVIIITRATLAASDLRVLCSGSPSGVAALGNKKYTANSFLFICSSPHSFSFLLSLFSSFFSPTLHSLLYPFYLFAYSKSS